MDHVYKRMIVWHNVLRFIISSPFLLCVFVIFGFFILCTSIGETFILLFFNHKYPASRMMFMGMIKILTPGYDIVRTVRIR